MAITAGVTNGKLDPKYTTADKDANEPKDGRNLGYDQFLQLLCAEMQNQDPLEPTSNTDYVAQMATFSQLEATLSMKDSLSSSLAETQKSSATALVGKEVVVNDPTSETGYSSGTVDYFIVEDGEIKLSINDKMYAYKDLYSLSTDEYYDAIVNSKTFSGLVASLPEMNDLTTSSQEMLKTIRKLFDSLTDYQKQFISSSDYSKLERYEKKMEELLASENESGEATDDTENETGNDVDNSQEVGNE